MEQEVANVLVHSTKKLDFLSKEGSVSDAAVAGELLDKIIGSRGVREGKTSMLSRAYELLVKHNPDHWNGRERRVRSIFDGEARRVDHYEIEDMREILEARKRHAAHKQETTRLVAEALARHAD